MPIVIPAQEPLPPNRTIRILPEAIRRSVRAGEVVERPAAAVKELIENALDAGATRIDVVLDAGGRKLVSVCDDGRGIGPEDLSVCLLPHATSKLEGVDPDRIVTLGYRGEALAALAAVADVRVTSRTREGECAWTVSSTGMDGHDPLPCAGRHGTTVTASDIFSGHPSRAAFLRTPRAEAQACRETMVAAALVNPQVSFSMVSDGKPMLSLAAGDHVARASAIMGQPFMANSLLFQASTDRMGTSGFVAVPSWDGHGAAGQRLSVNGRPIRDRTMSSALRAAFSDLSGQERPAAVVALVVDPSAVDVHRHPAKAEVRLRDPDGVHAFLRDTIRHALSGGATRVQALSMPVAAVPALPDPHDARQLPFGRALTVVDGVYAVTERKDGIAMVDLHAASERQVYESLLRSGSGTRELERPVTLHVGEREATILLTASERLAMDGLVLSHGMEGFVTVTHLPGCLPTAALPGMLRDAAQELGDNGHADVIGEGLRRIHALVACHSAFRKGDAISLDEVDGMLRLFERTPNMSTCMHGRPTIAAITSREMASLFKR